MIGKSGNRIFAPLPPDVHGDSKRGIRAGLDTAVDSPGGRLRCETPIIASFKAGAIMSTDERNITDGRALQRDVIAADGSREIDQLLLIMAALRTPVTGCPWDLAQDFASIAPYTLEEAQEVVEAIQQGDRQALCEELGDLLLQVVFHARMAEEEGSFAFGDVVQAITRKMIRRHPHVFGDRKQRTNEEVNANWQRIKAEEKAERLAARLRCRDLTPASASILDGVLTTQPALVARVEASAKGGKGWF